MQRFAFPIAIVFSLFGHIALLAIFLFCKHPERDKSMKNSGGVVWINPNPGGSGTGGAGGWGAPLQDSSLSKIAQKATETTRLSTLKTNLTRVKQTQRIQKTVEKSSIAGLAREAPGISGPGQGEGNGEKSGSGQGEGEGKGHGKGSGHGEGQGPGGEGVLGYGNGRGGDVDPLHRIKAKILRVQRYPRLAREQGLEGNASILFRINPDGSIADLSLLSSSGFEILDTEALATIKRAAPFPYYAGDIHLSLNFDLTHGTH